MVSYQSKRNKNTVALSTMHDEGIIDARHSDIDRQIKAMVKFTADWQRLVSAEKTQRMELGEVLYLESGLTRNTSIKEKLDCGVALWAMRHQPGNHGTWGVAV
nr:hypothetical protein BaRGS_010236 [Batillaria attramentaria]